MSAASFTVSEGLSGSDFRRAGVSPRRESLATDTPPSSGDGPLARGSSLGGVLPEVRLIVRSGGKCHRVARIHTIGHPPDAIHITMVCAWVLDTHNAALLHPHHTLCVDIK